MPVGPRPSLALLQRRGSARTPLPQPVCRQRSGPGRAGSGTAGSAARGPGRQPGTATPRARTAHAPRHPPEPRARRRLRSKRARPLRSRPPARPLTRAGSSLTPALGSAPAARPSLPRLRGRPAATRPAGAEPRPQGGDGPRPPHSAPPLPAAPPPAAAILGRQTRDRASAGQPSAERLQRGARGAGRRLAERIDVRRGASPRGRAALGDTHGTHTGHTHRVSVPARAPTPPPPLQACPRSP
nr:translation initiation factor IF-2-like [Taeniopygia guttata]